MHFQIPQGLIQSVADYDTVLKKVYAQQKKEQKGAGNSKPRMTLGVPDDLLPVELVSKERQIQLVRKMNTTPNKDRAIVLTESPLGCGLLLYSDSRWFSFWFFYRHAIAAYPELLAKHDYVYGMAMAYRNTEATLARIPRIIMGWKDTGDTIALDDISNTKTVKYGKVEMVKHTLVVTADLIRSGITRIPLENVFKSYTVAGREKYRAHANWRNELRKNIPNWDDRPGTFDRIIENGDIRRCVFRISRERPDSSLTKSFREMVKDSVVHEMKTVVYYTNENLDHKVFIDLLETPFFKKEVNKAASKAEELYASKDTTSSNAVEKPITLLQYRMKSVARAMTIYPDLSLDYCQQIYAIGLELGTYNPSRSSIATEWFRNNVPVASFVQILNKKAQAAESSRWTNSITGTKTVDMNDLSDVFNMIRTIGESQKRELGPEFKQAQITHPDRWRLAELHDHLTAECFKISTPNEKLRQDLFPEPVKVVTDDQRWSFFQPFDVHQLASWGKAVRNCVGSASSYRDGIKKKTHFIVLAMLDGKPRFTIQLKLSNAVMNVEQIADIGNRSLSSEERNSYQRAFSEALSVRASQVTPQANENTSNENVLC